MALAILLALTPIAIPLPAPARPAAAEARVVAEIRSAATLDSRGRIGSLNDRFAQVSRPRMCREVDAAESPCRLIVTDLP